MGIDYMGRRLACGHCGHAWFARQHRRPALCPKCGNARWEEAGATVQPAEGSGESPIDMLAQSADNESRPPDESVFLLQEILQSGVTFAINAVIENLKAFYRLVQLERKQEAQPRSRPRKR